jgi:hypothetical protein
MSPETRQNHFKSTLPCNTVDLNSVPIHGPLNHQWILEGPVSCRIQVTLTVRAFAISVSAYQRFYFSIMWSINVLSAVTVEAAAQVHWVARAVPLSHSTILTPGTTNEGLSWCIAQNMHRHLYVSRFTRFRYTRRFTGTQPPRVTRVTCVTNKSLQI